MPRRPAFPTPCATPGCPALTRDRHCPEHQSEAEVEDWKRRRPQRVGKRNRQIYKTRRWTDRVRPQQLAREPLCEPCQRAGKWTLATVVHHRRPINLGGDPWAEDNLESVCASCHPREEMEAQGEYAEAGA